MFLPFDQPLYDFFLTALVCFPIYQNSLAYADEINYFLKYSDSTIISTWEILSLVYRLRSIYSHLSQQVEICHQQTGYWSMFTGCLIEMNSYFVYVLWVGGTIYTNYLPSYYDIFGKTCRDKAISEAVECLQGNPSGQPRGASIIIRLEG